MSHICPWWLAYTFDNPLRKLIHTPERLFAPYVREGMRVADIGCGMGYFSLGLARMVGNIGQVLAVDIQEKMLSILMVRARKAGTADIITPLLCGPDNINIAEPVDFALTFWMVHESPDMAVLLRQIFGALKPGASLLVAEPKLHVSQNEFAQEINLALSVGFHVKDRPSVALSHAVTLTK